MKRLSDVDYIVDDNGCWIWQLGTSGGGYGVKWDKDRKKSMGAHRWHYEQARGPVPKGLWLDHLCRVRQCVNPDHLEPVTPKENLHRGPRISGDRCKRGHLRTPETVMTNSDGSTKCYICHCMTQRDYWQRRLDEVLEKVGT